MHQFFVNKEHCLHMEYNVFNQPFYLIPETFGIAAEVPVILRHIYLSLQRGSEINE